MRKYYIFMYNNNIFIIDIYSLFLSQDYFIDYNEKNNKTLQSVYNISRFKGFKRIL